MIKIKQWFPFLAVGSFASVMILPGSTLAASISAVLSHQPSAFGYLELRQSVSENWVSSSSRSRDRDEDDDRDDDERDRDDDHDERDHDDDDRLIHISGRVIGFGEQDENEWIVESGGRRYRVDAGPRHWRNLPVTVGDRLSIKGELDEGELDAFWVQLANGETIQLRGRSGLLPWVDSHR
jgi:ABC-type Zn2+ transport system substrate-binding protein/surface adhesin